MGNQMENGMETILRIGACRDCVRSEGTMNIPVPFKGLQGILGV